MIRLKVAAVCSQCDKRFADDWLLAQFIQLADFGGSGSGETFLPINIGVGACQRLLLRESRIIDDAELIRLAANQAQPAEHTACA